MSGHWNPFLVDQECSEVPFDCIENEASLFGLEVVVQGNGIVSIDINLVKHVPFDAILLGIFLEVNRTQGFLTHELVAGKTKDSQPLLLVLCIHFIQLFVVALCVGTL